MSKINFPNSHHEHSLWSHISASRQPQLLKLLSGIAGMVPESYRNHHLVYKPKRPRATGPGGQELYYIQLVCRVPEESELPGASTDPPAPGKYEVRQQRWTMRLEDLPEVNRKPVTTRNIFSATTGMGDTLEFMESLGYTLQAAYFMDCIRLIHGNIVITLSQVLVPEVPETEDPDKVYGNPFTMELKQVDPAKSWILQAAVRVVSSMDVESANIAVAELKALKDVLRGACDLDMPERLALDPRAR